MQAQRPTSFETYDALATENRTPDQAAAVITDLARRALGIADPGQEKR